MTRFQPISQVACTARVVLDRAVCWFPGGQEASVFQLASKAGDYRLIFWRNTTEVVEVDFGSQVYNATHIDWWGMKMIDLAPIQGKVSLSPPAGADSIVQLIWAN